MLDADKRVVDRDHNLNDLFALVRTIAEDVASLRSEVGSVKQSLASHMVTEEDNVREMSREFNKFSSLYRAFPEIDDEPDIDGHRNDHLTRMGEARDKKRRLEKARDDVVEIIIKGLTYGVLFLMLTGARDWLENGSTPSVSHLKNHIEESK